jgi:MFS family permease
VTYLHNHEQIPDNQIGQILGLQVTGWASERYGYRPTMLTALVCLTGFLFIQFFAVNLPMLLVGYLLLGFPWGTFQVSPARNSSRWDPNLTPRQ